MSYFETLYKPCLLDRLRATQVTGIRPNYIYGLLYNWYAASDERIGNSGFTVPTDAELTAMRSYTSNVNLHSTRAVPDPHPRWNTFRDYYTDLYKFSILPSGQRRLTPSTFDSIGAFALMWAGTEDNAYNGWRIQVLNDTRIFRGTSAKHFGHATRLTRLATAEELAIPEGEIIPNYYKGNNNFLYDCVRINDRIWLAQNLAETKWIDGTDIPFAGANGINFTGGEWAALITPGVCAYDNDAETWAYTLP